MTALDRTADWPVSKVSAAVLVAGTVVSTIGDIDRPQRIASISKPMATWAILVAIEEGVIALDTPIGQTGCTLEHLLSHAGGYSFDGERPITRPERTRIYSNTGFDLAAGAVEQATGITFVDYIEEALFAPLMMTSSKLIGSAAHGVHSSVRDVSTFVSEVRTPRLIAPATAETATCIHYPSLAGMVPGVGRYTPCPWGLGFELRGEKQPHWTGSRNGTRTFGHFGGSGTMFWVDPDVDLGLVAIADREFGAWALSAWPALSDDVVDEFARPTGASA